MKFKYQRITFLAWNLRLSLKHYPMLCKNLTYCMFLYKDFFPLSQSVKQQKQIYLLGEATMKGGA